MWRRIFGVAVVLSKAVPSSGPTWGIPYLHFYCFVSSNYGFISFQMVPQDLHQVEASHAQVHVQVGQVGVYPTDRNPNLTFWTRIFISAISFIPYYLKHFFLLPSVSLYTKLLGTYLPTYLLRYLITNS